MSYIANTPSDQEAMLKRIGINSGNVDDLFNNIPATLRLDALNLPPGKSELEVSKILHQMAGRNTSRIRSKNFSLASLRLAAISSRSG